MKLVNPERQEILWSHVINILVTSTQNLSGPMSPIQRSLDPANTKMEMDNSSCLSITYILSFSFLVEDEEVE